MNGDDDVEVAPSTVQPLAKPAPAPVDPLRFLRSLAILGVVALVFGRFVAPALPGAIVGMSRVVRAFEILGGALSQLFGVAAIVGVVLALLATVPTSMPSWLRLLGIAVAGYAALIVLGGAATNDHVPEASALLAATFAGSFAVATAVASRSSRVARLPALLLGLVGTAAVIRACSGFVLLYGARSIAPEALLRVGRTTATISALLVALTLMLALVYIGRSAKTEPTAGVPGRPTVWSPATLAVLVLAVLCARQATLGAAADAGMLNVLLKRAADRFLVQPEPHFRLPIRLFLGFLTPLTAAALLFVRRLPTLTSALALLLVAADITDSPLGSITVVLASLGIVSVARSGHVLWSQLVDPSAPRPAVHDPPDASRRP